MGWLSKGFKKVVGAHKKVVSGAFGGKKGRKKVLSAGLGLAGIKVGGKAKKAKKPKRERYKRKVRNQWVSRSRRKFNRKQKRQGKKSGLLGSGLGRKVIGKMGKY